jgi:predicted patatin/cPLA2 family phospholipase
MINNIPYYSAPSREAQVKKIMSVSGGTYSLSNFISNDVQKAPAAVATLLTKSFNPLTFVPLAPPVMKK